MYAISVEFEIHPAHNADFTRLALRHAANTLKNEVGCLRFDVFRHEERAHVFYFHEAYVDKAAVTEVHVKAPYLAEFFAAAEPWIRSKNLQTWHELDKD